MRMTHLQFADLVALRLRLILFLCLSRPFWMLWYSTTLFASALDFGGCLVTGLITVYLSSSVLPLFTQSFNLCSLFWFLSIKYVQKLGETVIISGESGLCSWANDLLCSLPHLHVTWVGRGRTRSDSEVDELCIRSLVGLKCESSCLLYSTYCLRVDGKVWNVCLP